MRKKIIAACGNDCSVCPRKTAKTAEQLGKTAELWMRVGYRDTIVSATEIACSGCKPTNVCRYGIVSCTAEKKLADCAECKAYPCEKFNACLERTLEFQSKIEKNASFEEGKNLKAAFFRKRENLDRLLRKRSSLFARLKRRLFLRAQALKTDIPAIFLCLKRSSTPLFAKITAGLCAVYALSPIDLIPDFIPLFGYLDDLVILPALITLTVKLIPKEVFDECRAEAQRQNASTSKKWYFALPLVLIWAAVLLWLVKAVFF